MNHVFSKRAQTKTHPWEDDIDDKRFRMVWFSLLFTALFIILFQTATAQKVFLFPEPDVSNVEDTELKKLSRAELQTAEDFQEIMSELDFLIRHHLEYFSKYKKFEGRKYQNLLLKSLIKLERGYYCADVETLSADLTNLIKELMVEEKSLKNDKSLKKLYKNVRTLRADIEVLKDVLNEELAYQLEDNKASLAEIKVFLQNQREHEKQQEEYQLKMYDLREQIHEGVKQLMASKESLKFVFNEKQMQEFIEAEKLHEELEEVLNMVFSIELPNQTITITVPSDSTVKEITIPKISIQPKAPKIPTVPKVPEIRTHYSYNLYGNSRLSHKYQDSLYVKSSDVPIYIDNKLGDIEIQGWDKNKIVTSYYYEVVSDSEEDAEEFLESIKLKQSSDNSGVYISSDFPSLHNSKRQVVNSRMVLFLPKKNIINVTNSFGKTEISDMNNNIHLKAKNSDIIIEDVIGQIDASNKHGSTYISDVTGEVNVMSSRGSVTVEDLTSALTIINSHGAVLISDCTGEVSVDNSGETSVYDHIGNVEIQNKNGQTTVESLKGNLTLRGSYQPFYISSVDGSVDIENKNSIIALSDISGESIVFNKGGLIKAHSINGRIDFTNNGGEIYFIANNSLNGNSIIRSDYGMINIVLPQKSNILLQASTDGGSIVNSYKTKIKKDDFFSSTIIGLGNKSKKLNVSGTNATIIINDEQ